MNKKATWIAATTIIIGGTSILAAFSTNYRLDEVDETLFLFEQDMYTEVQGGDYVSAEQAKDIALAQYDGQIKDMKLKTNQKTVYYEIKINNGRAEDEVYINFYTGEFLQAEKANLSDEKTADIMSINLAIKIALNKVSGDIENWELEKRNDRYEYKIKLNTKDKDVNMTIDATTGKVVVIEME